MSDEREPQVAQKIALSAELAIMVSSLEHEAASLEDLSTLFASLHQHEASLLTRATAKGLREYAKKRLEREARTQRRVTPP